MKKLTWVTVLFALGGIASAKPSKPVLIPVWSCAENVRPPTRPWVLVYVFRDSRDPRAFTLDIEDIYLSLPKSERAVAAGVKGPGGPYVIYRSRTAELKLRLPAWPLEPGVYSAKLKANWRVESDRRSDRIIEMVCFRD